MVNSNMSLNITPTISTRNGTIIVYNGADRVWVTLGVPIIPVWENPIGPHFFIDKEFQIYEIRGKMEKFYKVIVPELLIPEMDSYEYDSVFSILDNYERAAITRGRKKKKNGGSLTEYEFQCMQLFDALLGSVACPVHCETDFKNGRLKD
jgi:hypothetical protein